MSAGPKGSEAARPARRFPRPRVSGPERARMREEMREVDFPIVLRGYDRAAVDRYMKQVNRLIAELEISSSPESAVRRALEEVSEETSGLLQRAYDTADEITARSRAKADDRLEQAEREAAELREAAVREAEETRETAQRETRELRAKAVREANELSETAAREAQQVSATVRRELEEMRAAAEARVRELDRDADAIWWERRRLLDDMREVAQQQLEIAEAAAQRFARTEPVSTEPPTARDSAAEDGHAAVDEPRAAQPRVTEQI
jgi:DivIVA domain-containing protein